MYSDIKTMLRGVLAGKGLAESNHFDITEDGAIIQSEGYAIVLGSVNVADRYTGKAKNMSVQYNVHVAKSYEPAEYADADDVLGELVDDVLAEFEEISIATLQSHGVIGIVTAEARAEHFEQGVVHVTLPLTVTYRRA
jgi:hypothetical protein